MNRMVHKITPVLHAKALNGNEALGTFEAVWAVFGNEDADGDVLEPGAFLDSWARKMPKVVWSHSWTEVPIGVTLDAEELTREQLDRLLATGVPDDVTGGAWAKARLAVDVAAGEDNPRAREVYTALKMLGGDGRSALDEFSWGGRVTSETVEQRENSFPLWHINTVDQTEWGPCVKGANPATRLLAAKSFDLERALRIANGEFAVDGVTKGDVLASRKLISYRTLTLNDAKEVFGMSTEPGEGTHDPQEQPGREPAEPREDIPESNPETDPPKAPVQPEDPDVTTPEQTPEQRARVADLLLS
jgi:hypothetical protein